MRSLDIGANTQLRDAVAVADRPERASALATTLTFAHRALLKIKHVPEQLFDVTLTPVIFTLMFTYLFGGAIAGDTSTYLQFLLPGIIVMTVLTVSVYTGFTLNTDITKGVFDRFRSLPIARSAPLAGRIIADTAKQAWSMMILLAVGFIIGFRIETNVLALLLAFALLLGFAVLFSWTSVYIAMKVNEPEKVQIFGFVVIFPLSFMSTAFIPSTDGIPSGLAFAMDNSPVTHLVEAMRGLLVGGPVLNHALIALLWGVAISLVFAPLSLRAFKKRA